VTDEQREEILARIERDRAETQKLFEETRAYVAEAHRSEAERRKLEEESVKLAAEGYKFDFEALKFKRDRALAFWQVIFSLITAIAALIAADAIARLRPLAQLLNL
jgi:hypothetical protein